MKAKDYFEKYGERLVSADQEVHMQATKELLLDLLDETDELFKKRKPMTEKATNAIINEVNDKWNALCDMLNPPVLKRNGWKTWFVAEVIRHGNG